jgi:PAS domain S-box-containing protein
MRASAAQEGGRLDGLDVPAEPLLEAILDASHDAVVVCDPEGRIVHWTETCERVLGFPGSAVVGMDFWALFAEHVRADVEKVVGRVAAGERILRLDSETVRHDGMPMPVSLSMSPVPPASEAPMAVVAIVRDATEERLAQATLAEMDVRLQEGEALAHVGSWLWDVRTDVVQWSIEFHRLHDVDPLDFSGTLEGHLSVVHPDDRDGLLAAMQNSVVSGRPFEFEYRVGTGPTGTHRVLVRGQPALGSAGVVVGLRGVGRGVHS